MLTNHQLIKRIFAFLVALLGIFAVLFGAFIAHKSQALPEKVAASLSIAMNYHLYHLLALLACLVWFDFRGSRPLVWAMSAFALGILFFSFTIYAKSFFDIGIIAALTPVGGMCFALGWGLLAFVGMKSKQ